MKRTRWVALTLLMWVGLLALELRAQTSQTLEQLQQQIEALQEKGKNRDNWSPALQRAYDESLQALKAAYEKAKAEKAKSIDEEIKQLEDMLKDITLKEARESLEKRLKELKALKQQRDAEANDKVAKEKETGDRFTLIVHARVKGTGYPVTDAHIQLLKLTPDSDPPEYSVMESGFHCGNYNKRCVTRRDANGLATAKIIIDVPQTPPTLKVTALDNPYYPAVLGETIVPAAGIERHVYLDMVPKDGENFRVILGAEQAGSSGSENTQNIFMDLFISRPLLRTRYYTENCNNSNNGRSCNPPIHRIWGDVRLTSVPQPRQNLFQALNGSFGTALNGAIGKVSDLDTGLSFQAGYQARLTTGTIAATRFDLSLIVGGGAVAALSPEKTVPIFNKPTDKQRLDALKEKLKVDRSEAEAAKYAALIDGGQYDQLAFVPRGRDRFFRNYFGGFRFEIHSGDTTPVRPSGMFDLTFGQDEAVTKGQMRGAVMRLDGFFPLPLGHNNLVYLFGTAQMALKKVKTSDPLLLPLADTTQTLTSPKTLVIPVPASNRDLYRIGVGVNLLQVFTGKTDNK